MPDTMYPDWPLSSADLVPLPMCDGPKLEPFDFQGPQEIDFLEYIGEGLHAHVVKVQIHGKIYALKLFRFCNDENWHGPALDTDPDDRTLMSAFYDYSEPFSCECRAFGRLKEAGHEDLAIRCFGYVLLDEEHERKMRRRFTDIMFNGDVYSPVADIKPGGDIQDAEGIEKVLDMRGRFLGRDGRRPPIRGIVKEYASLMEEDEMQAADARKLLSDVIKLQQLGIMHLDIAIRQLIGGKVCDFSTAVTMPHFMTSPELNPGLTREMRDAIDLETFCLAKDDYVAFNEMIYGWNLEHAENKGAITVRAFPGGRGAPRLRRYELRNQAARERVYTYVDPRRYNWKTPTMGTKKRRRRLRAKPQMWIYKCGEDSELAAELREFESVGPRLDWDYQDGFIFPRMERTRTASPDE